jgi:hypothetical protein
MRDLIVASDLRRGNLVTDGVNRPAVQCPAQIVRQDHDLGRLKALHRLELSGQYPVGELVHQPDCRPRVCAEFLSRQ